jgi:hypothetical protein
LVIPVAILCRSSWFLFRFPKAWNPVPAGSALLRFSCSATQTALKPCIHAGIQKNLPPFTLRLFEGFVNGKSGISTGFFGFFGIFVLFLAIFVDFQRIRRNLRPPKASPAAAASGLSLEE